MGRLVRSYLDYARGQSGRFSPWSVSLPLDWLARGWVRCRNGAFDRGILEQVEPPLPVVSVGNISLGGTNKTPMVEYLARHLLEAGVSVGVVSRGYSGASPGPLEVGRGDVPRELAGDEPLMLARMLPRARVLVCRDRLAGVRRLAELGAEAVVADDAFQHRRLGRDVDLVLVDATCPFGNGRLLPAGLLREPLSSLERADLVVVTKSDQVSPEEQENLRRTLSKWVAADRLFFAEIRLLGWRTFLSYPQEVSGQAPPPGARVVVFSAIGNPESLHRLVRRQGLEAADQVVFRDHHRFSEGDLADLRDRARELGAQGLVCTEKDLFNLPGGGSPGLPLWVPRIGVALREEARFWERFLEILRPRLLVASNGYGEDAIGVLLARKLRDRFPEAQVSAFALVGRGTPYIAEGFPVLSPPSELPSGGVIKYSLRAFLKDLRHGLPQDILRQLRAWRGTRGGRTPLCVGDVYLLLHALWGQGVTPALVATAKTVFLSGHWRAERWFLRHRCRRVWARDEETAEELRRSGVDARFRGNPIMDLTADPVPGGSPWTEGEGSRRVLLLPGSRQQAYGDTGLLLEVARRLHREEPTRFVLVPAPTLDLDRLMGEQRDWTWRPEVSLLSCGDLEVRVFSGSLADAARGAEVLLGLGGTANQVCAGLGVPVVSLDDRGKQVQKKLLQDAEVLVPRDPEALAGAVRGVLTTPELRHRMIETGIRRLGGPGALDDVVAFAARDLGWGARCTLWGKLAGRAAGPPDGSIREGDERP